MLEAYIENKAVDYEQQLCRYLANGWYIYSLGLTITIMRKDITKD